MIRESEVQLTGVFVHDHVANYGTWGRISAAICVSMRSRSALCMFQWR